MRIHTGDCREFMDSLAANSIDAIVTDPPYELGFMGKAWDSTGVAFDVATWTACLRVLKPGGHLLAFGGTRTAHRMVCAIEDAGFQVRDSIGWIYATGFPKSLDVSKAIDKAAGAVRAVLGTESNRGASTAKDGKKSFGDYAGQWDMTAPAITWSGWGTALKPAIEPICLARKPLGGTVASNVLEHGTGALNIGACRVGDEEITTNGGDKFPNLYGDFGTAEETVHAGRWPANVMLHEDADVGPATRFFYVAKPSRRERDAGLASGVGALRDAGRGTPRANTHPTVKPIALMRELVRLVTPPGGTVLDPFLGSGTTGCAAVLEGFDFVGVELLEAHSIIAAERIRHWQEQGATS